MTYCKLKVIFLLFLFSCNQYVTIPITSDIPANRAIKKITEAQKTILLLIQKKEYYYIDVLLKKEHQTFSKQLSQALISQFQKSKYYEVIDATSLKSTFSKLKDTIFMKTPITPELWNTIMKNDTNTNDYSTRANLFLLILYDITNNCPLQQKNTTSITQLLDINIKLINVQTGSFIEKKELFDLNLNNSQSKQICQNPQTISSKYLDIYISEYAQIIQETVSLQTSNYLVPISLQFSKNSNKQIKKLVKQGNKLAKQRNFDVAKKKWIESLNIQDNIAAKWNLAIYYWYFGDWKLSKQFFQNFEKKIDPKKITPKQKRILKQFKKQYKNVYSS